MPKKKHRKNQPNDFTIKDFADSNFTSFRPKKSNQNVETIKQPLTLLGQNEDKLWDEDSEEELNNEEEVQNLEIIPVPNSIRDDCDETLGFTYSPILWFLISEHILPEDVGRFAGICKSTHYTTTFAKFWSDLYKKHCRPFKFKLPDYLQPECVTRRHGLRSLVIRSLYYTYPPFDNKPPSTQVCTPQQLLKCPCASVWFVRVKGRWCLYFKMVYLKFAAKKFTKNIMDLLDDVHANSQSAYKILQITCGSFTECTSAMGMTLTIIKASIGTNMRSSRLLLGFSSSARDQPTFNVILDNVVKTEVYDWWHPKYPHPGEVLPTSSVASPNKFNTSIDAVENI